VALTFILVISISYIIFSLTNEVPPMTEKDHFLSKKHRYQPLILPQSFSDEEMARDWTLTQPDCNEINKYRKHYRLNIAIQLCAMRLYGQFLKQVNDLSSRIINYLSNQLELPPSLTILVPDREATVLEHRKNILNFLGFRKWDGEIESKLTDWIKGQANRGILPDELFHQAEKHLMLGRIVLPGPCPVI